MELVKILGLLPVQCCAKAVLVMAGYLFASPFVGSWYHVEMAEWIHFIFFSGFLRPILHYPLWTYFVYSSTDFYQVWRTGVLSGWSVGLELCASRHSPHYRSSFSSVISRLAF